MNLALFGVALELYPDLMTVILANFIDPTVTDLTTPLNSLLYIQLPLYSKGAALGALLGYWLLSYYNFSTDSDATGFSWNLIYLALALLNQASDAAVFFVPPLLTYWQYLF